MAIELPGAKVFGEVKRENVLEAAGILKVPARNASRTIDDMLRGFSAAVAQITDEFAKGRERIPAEANRFLGMQQRLLDVVRTMTYSDMAKALAG